MEDFPGVNFLKNQIKNNFHIYHTYIHDKGRMMSVPIIRREVF